MQTRQTWKTQKIIEMKEKDVAVNQSTLMKLKKELAGDQIIDESYVGNYLAEQQNYDPLFDFSKRHDMIHCPKWALSFKDNPNAFGHTKSYTRITKRYKVQQPAQQMPVQQNNPLAFL